VKILFTGASSFTGFWFTRQLAATGHEVVMVFQRQPADYDGARRQRVDGLCDAGRCEYGCSFGDERFVQLIAAEPSWDLLCHHAADVANYKSPDFDVSAALSNNTRNLRAVLTALADKGCRRILLTGSVFEQNEGAGSDGLPAFSPYGLSKGLTADVFRHYAGVFGLRLGKFVIPNPFGPYEEPRFTAYLMRNWFAGKTPAVNTPDYVRDNIHVSLLAKAYADFAQGLPTEPGFQKVNPSGYVESQGAFAARFAREMHVRLDLPCELELKQHTNFTEPRIRVNTDLPNVERLRWDESRSWDQLANYYRQVQRGRADMTGDGEHSPCA